MITPDKNTQIFIIRPINNRHDRRQANREAKKALSELGKIESEFTSMLFDKMSDELYVSLYRGFNDMYIKAVDWMVTRFKPRYIYIDRMYFCNNYKPKERQS